MSNDASTPLPLAITRLVKRVRQARDFTPDPVPAAALRDILDVARWTGSAGNRQPWTFILVTDAATKRRMAEVATNTPHIGIAPLVVCIAMAERGAETDNFDEGRLAERVMIAAAAHGLSTGIGRVMGDARPAMRELLGVPDGHVVRTMVSVGTATPEGLAPKSPKGEARKPLEELIRHERFG